MKLAIVYYSASREYKPFDAIAQNMAPDQCDMSRDG